MEATFWRNQFSQSLLLKKLVTSGYYDCLLLLIQRVTTLTTHMGTTNVYFDWLQLAIVNIQPTPV